jgi:putative transposase
MAELDLEIMRAMDEVHTRRPYYGSPRLTQELKKKHGLWVNHKKVERLMKVMGLETLYPKPRLSLNGQPHLTYPYLLSGLHITQPNQVWGVDITYIRLCHGFLYLVALIDWYSRYVLAWELSDTLTSDFCCAALERALSLAIPGIHNSDQGVQFTAEDYLKILQTHPDIRISMDHKGRCFDNIFTERLWRTVKYEEVYLKEYASPKDAKSSLGEYFTFYNEDRFHSALNYRTPAAVYFNNYSGEQLIQRR